MKRLLLILYLSGSISVISSITALAQRSEITDKPKSLFFQGKEMFFNRNYIGAQQTFSQFLQSYNNASNAPLISEAEYFILASQYYLGDKDSISLLKNFLEQYPSTGYANQIRYFIASSYFANGEWELARKEFYEVDPDILSVQDREDYAYRYGFASLQNEEYNKSQTLFRRVLNSPEYSVPASYYLAYIDFQKKRYSEANTVFNLLKNNPEYGNKSMFYLTEIAYLEANYDNTIQLALACIEKNKHTLPPLSNIEQQELYRILGSSYYNLDEQQKAFEYYQIMNQMADNIKSDVANESEETLSIKNQFPLDYYRLGKLYYQHGNYEEAIKTLTRSASEDSIVGQASNMLLGQCYMKIKNYNRALMYFDLASRVSYDPNITEEALYNYVMLSNQTVDVFGQSIESFKKFLEKYPNSKYKVEIYSTLENILLSTKDYDAALKALESLPSQPSNILVAKQTILYQQGVQYFMSKNFDLAIKKFDAVIDMEDFNPDIRKDAFFWRAEALFRLDNYEEAAQDFSSYVQAVSLSESNYLPALYNMGYSYFKEKQYSKALNGFSRYVAMEENTSLPTYADALNRLGDCYLFKRDYNEAIKNYQEAALLSPDAADYALFQESFVNGLQKDYAGKIKALNTMMQKYPDSPYMANALFEKSRALVMLNQNNEAINTLQELINKYPNSDFTAKAGVQLGQLYFNENRNKESIIAYKEVIQNYPNTEEARVALNSLEGVYKEINDINSYISFANSIGDAYAISSSRQDSLTFQSAENLYIKGQKVNSMMAMQDYLDKYPQGRFSSDANFYIASVLMDQKENQKAYTYLEAVINSNNPKYTDDALIYLSGIQYDQKNYNDAYNSYNKLAQRTSNPKTKSIANLGMLRSAYLLRNNAKVIEVSNQMLKDKSLSADVVNEMNFYRAKALLQENKLDAAYSSFEKVASNIRSEEGAESKYMMAEILYKKRNYNKSIDVINSFMNSGTPHKDWMARAVILLSNDYAALGNKDQALQYLESLNANYNGNNDEIKTEIKDKIAILKKELTAKSDNK